MASGSWNFGTSNQYITGRIRWYSSANGPSANSSTVTAYLDYMKSSASTAATYGTFNGSININGSVGGISGRITLYANNSWLTVGSHTVTVSHNGDGSKSITISASGGISGTSFGSSSTANNVTLDKIARYTTFSQWSVSDITQTTAKFTWQTTDTCNFARVYLNDSSQWTDIPGTVYGSSGTFIYKGPAPSGAASPDVSTLSPSKTYNLKLEVRRSDSGLWSKSEAVSFTTAPIAAISNENVNFNIGSDLTLTFKNHQNNRSFLALDVQNESGDWIKNVAAVGENIQAQSYVWKLSAKEIVNKLYGCCKNNNKLNIRIRCGTTINSVVYENSTLGEAVVTGSVPTFSTFSYGNSDNMINAVLGNASYILENYGNMQAHISIANKAVALNQASITKYTAYIKNSANTEIIRMEKPYSDTEEVIFDFGSTLYVAGTYSINIYAVDSRGKQSPTVTKTFAVLSYHRPTEEFVSIDLQRTNGYEKEIIANITAYYSKLKIGSVNKNNSFVIKYRYREKGAADWKSWITLSGYNSSDYSATDMCVKYSNDKFIREGNIIGLPPERAYDFEFQITDRICSNTIKTEVNQGIPIFMQSDTGECAVGMVPKWDKPAKLQVASDILAVDSEGNERLILEDIDKKNSDLLNRIEGANAELTVTNNNVAELNSKLLPTNCVQISKTGFYDDEKFITNRNGILIGVFCVQSTTLNNSTTGFIQIHIYVNSKRVGCATTAGGAHYYDGTVATCVVAVNKGDTISFATARNTDTPDTKSSIQFIII